MPWSLKRLRSGPPGFMHKELDMPKVKTKSGAAKRFRALAGGGIKRSRANLRHILTKMELEDPRELREYFDRKPD